MATVTLEVTRETDLPPEAVWPVLADMDGYAAHVVSLADTTVIAGAAHGARRRCVDTRGRRWEETCVLWEEGRRYVIDVDVATYPVDLRAIFRALRGTWEVTPHGDGGCTIVLRLDADVRGGRAGALLVDRLAARARRDLQATLDSYVRTARSGTTAGPPGP